MNKFERKDSASSHRDVAARGNLLGADVPADR